MNPSETTKTGKTENIQLITFRCGSLLIGLELTDVQEINRINRLAEVPDAPLGVRGVINLRGEVVTMIDLRVVLHQSDDFETASHHNVFVRSEGEVIGLVTDGVSDIVTIAKDTIDAPPSNLKGIEVILFKGVHTMADGELMVVLDLTQLLATVIESTASTCT